MKIKSDKPSNGLVAVRKILYVFYDMLPKTFIFKLVMVASIIGLSNFVWNYSGPISIWLFLIAAPLVFASDIVDKISLMIVAGLLVASLCTADIFEKKYDDIPIKIDKVEFIDSTEKIIIHSNVSNDVIIIAPKATTYYNMKEHQESLKIYLKHIGKFDYYDKKPGNISEHEYYVFADYGKGEIRISDKGSPYVSSPTEVFKNLK